MKKKFTKRFSTVWLLSTFLFSIFLTPGAQAQDNRQLVQEDDKQAQKRIALVIGNGSYTDSPLRNPVNDATDMSATLKSLGFEVSLLTNSNQTAMKRAIRSFGERLRSTGGIGLFYYAGHGVQVKGINYLIPVGATVNTEEEVEYEGIDVGLVLAQMESAKNKMNIVILDACRNNPFARSYRSAEKGLASIDAPSGTLIAYATAPGSVASDGDGRNGLYTQELLKQMKTANLSIEDVFKRVRVSVLNATANKQTPWENSSLTGDFYFLGKGDKTTAVNTRTEPVKVVPLPTVDEVLNDYYKAVGGGRAVEIGTFILKGTMEGEYNGQKFTGQIESYLKFPGKSLTFIKFNNGNTTKEVFDGDKGWIHNSVKGTRDATSQQIESQKLGTAMALGDIDAVKGFFSKMTVKGRERLDDKDVFILEAVTLEGKTEKFYFDADTKLLLRSDFFQTSVATQQGVSFSTEMYFENYANLNGFQFPLSTRQKVSSGGVYIIRYNAAEIKFGVPIDDKLFKKP